jgi:molybdopterin synthase sulfur carrier subunit
VFELQGARRQRWFHFVHEVKRRSTGASLQEPRLCGIAFVVATVEITKHLWEFLPTLRNKTLTVEAATVADVVKEVERVAPGFTYYICDERGCLRTHVNIFVGDERIWDRTRLSDPVPDGARVLIMQALSGG